jgi:hypothetical protein
MTSFSPVTFGRIQIIAGRWCSSRRRQMPRRYLRVLPSSTRPSLFAGD